ncbi:long-chain-fatty-acid--CoA ligase [Chelativorans salis]|uniref:Long-chain-fatty-acid--CoA ligase n=1 Tax=Chelativorans salis TaxID=2978478 RepID=A0ABT2LKW9_9HYPH|nr:long-chain-fatty-acid--CoA ligase [Chelativorans sp. EGI FJ00035]MCT7374457.1 long-chain-fatty-acid--CoA ligase [Chelativorans sp. EGI FJ00035]
MAKTTTKGKTGGEKKKTSARAGKPQTAASDDTQPKAAPKRSSTRAAAEKKPAAKTAAKAADTGKKSAKAATPKTAGVKTAAAKPASTRSATSKATASKAAGTKASGTKAAPAKTASARTTASKPARAAKAAQKPWLKSYPKEIPAEIGAFEHSSLGDMLLASCRAFAERPAFTCMDKTLTFAELEKASRDFAAYLQSKGLKKGARVAIMMPNVLQYPVVMLAALRAGFVVVNVNPLYTPRELEHQLKDAGAEAIVILENFAKTLQTAIGKTDVKHVVVATMGDMMGLKGHIVNFVVRRVKKLVPAWELPDHVPFKSAMKKGAGLRFEPTDVGIDDIAFLQYTGGTTGVAKGAMLLHRNVLANVMQNEIWQETAYLKRPRPERSVYICALPLYHIYALTVNAMMGMKLGAQNILIPNPRDIPALVKELGKYDFSVFPGLNTLFNALLNNEDFRKLDFKNLALTFGGGMAVQRSVAKRWKEVTGCPVAQGYGLSETSPVATVNRFDNEEFNGTIGLPIPSTDVAIRDDNGRDVKTGEVGEICIRGPQVMGGYWNRPDETKKSMTKDGFFKSGDMGVMDADGRVKIVDRKKDMINVSGFNVYPNELEDVVAQHPGVSEVAAIGVPDEHSGEVPKLFVVKKDDSLTEEDIIAFCRKELTGYKRPKHVEFRSELPKSNVGKILRRELR